MKLALTLVGFICTFVPIIHADSWTISELDTHFMGGNSGLPGGAWPENAKFNATIDFTIRRVTRADASPFTTKCGCNYTTDGVSRKADAEPQYPPYPNGVWMACDKDGVAWRVKDTEAMTAANFTIEILVPEIDGVAMVTDKHTNLGLSYASVHISANNASNPSSYLTCMGGAPLAGIHCSFKENNVQLGLGGPIQLNMSQRIDTITPPFVLSSIILAPYDIDHCEDKTSFDITYNGSLPTSCTGSCPSAANPGVCAGMPGELFFWYITTDSNAEPSGNSTIHVYRKYTQRFSLGDDEIHQPNMLIAGSLDLSKALNGSCDGVTGMCSYESPNVVPVFGYDVVLGYQCH